MKDIYIAGGCFWGVKGYFTQLRGVEATEVGYAQGLATIVPTYEAVCTGTTGYTETLRLTYDPEQLPLSDILLHSFRFIDPTSLNKQGNDVGTQYRAGFYYTDPADAEVVTKFLAEQQVNYAQPIVVENEVLRTYHPAEEYHQDYLEKNPRGYCHVNLNLVKPEERK